MQQAIPYRTYIPASGAGGSPPADASGGEAGSTTTGAQMIKAAVSENAVIVIGQRGCCMCHVVQRLLLGLGVNPVVYEVEEVDMDSVVVELKRMAGIRRNDDDGAAEANNTNDAELKFPVVFVGGRLFGGLERVMATHISGELVPILREAGALWL